MSSSTQACCLTDDPHGARLALPGNPFSGPRPQALQRTARPPGMETGRPCAPCLSLQAAAPGLYAQSWHVLDRHRLAVLRSPPEHVRQNAQIARWRVSLGGGAAFASLPSRYLHSGQVSLSQSLTLSHPSLAHSWQWRRMASARVLGMQPALIRLPRLSAPPACHASQAVPAHSSIQKPVSSHSAAGMLWGVSSYILALKSSPSMPS